MNNSSRVCADFNRHTCIEVLRLSGVVKYIPLDILGLELVQMQVSKFDKVYSPISDYPVEKAAQLYAGYAAQLGGTKEAMLALSTITTLTSKEIEMATARKVTTAAAKAETAARSKANSKTTIKEPTTKPQKESAASISAKPAVRPVVKVKPTPVKKVDGDKKPSASTMFKELIMEGKLTDEQIFAVVQKEFGLDDNKRTYVRWYRNDLTKNGANPPAAKI